MRVNAMDKTKTHNNFITFQNQHARHFKILNWRLCWDLVRVGNVIQESYEIIVIFYYVPSNTNKEKTFELFFQIVII